MDNTNSCFKPPGLGMYEANAIQSGMDQMLEASSDRLSSFIHWYFWCSHIGSAIFLIAGESLISYCYIVNSELPITINHLFGWGSLVVSIVQLLTFIVGICISAWMKKYLYIEMSRNSLHLIFNVLKYAFNHKSPERRSAFTYWENGIPSRIDLGKDKYGGPFTYEQIEDVKAFFRLLLLILSLFGFHLLGDGFSYSHRVMNTFGCPSIMPFALIVANPKHVPTVVVLAGVPIIQCVRRYSSCIKFYFPSMLKTLWIGLFVSLLTQTVLVLYGFMLDQKSFDCPEFVSVSPASSSALIMKKCTLANAYVIINNTCSHFCTDPPVNSNMWVVYISIVYLVLYGISYLLVFMNSFLCSVSSRNHKIAELDLSYLLCST